MWLKIPLSQSHKLLAPKPVVLITTVNGNGKINAAPISWFMPVEFNPLVLTFSTSHESDTYRNIEEMGEFVVNLVPAEIREQMLICSKSFPHGVNELERAGLRWEPSERVKPPRVLECPVNFECKLEWVHKEHGYAVVAGRVVATHARKEAVKRGLLNVEVVKPLLHLSGRNFVIGDHRVGL